MASSHLTIILEVVQIHVHQVLRLVEDLAEIQVLADVIRDLQCLVEERLPEAVPVLEAVGSKNRKQMLPFYLQRKDKLWHKKVYSVSVSERVERETRKFFLRSVTGRIQ